MPSVASARRSPTNSTSMLPQYDSLPDDNLVCIRLMTGLHSRWRSSGRKVSSRHVLLVNFKLTTTVCWRIVSDIYLRKVGFDSRESLGNSPGTLLSLADKVAKVSFERPTLTTLLLDNSAALSSRYRRPRSWGTRRFGSLDGGKCLI